MCWNTTNPFHKRICWQQKVCTHICTHSVIRKHEVCIKNIYNNNPCTLPFSLRQFSEKQNDKSPIAPSDQCLLHAQHLPLFGRARVGVMTPLHVCRALVLQSAQFDHVHCGWDREEFKDQLGFVQKHNIWQGDHVTWIMDDWNESKVILSANE